MQKIALIGYSGHAYVVAEAVELTGRQLLGYYEKEAYEQNPFSIPYLGFEGNKENLHILSDDDIHFFVALGDNRLRKRLIYDLLSSGLKTTIVAHPISAVSSKATIGMGSFLAVGAKVNAMANIGIGVILNSGCIVEHEATIGNFVHIAPGAILAGNVKVGDESFIGAGAVIKQGVNIGSNTTIGAGAVVLKDVPDNQVWFGNPARQFRK